MEQGNLGPAAVSFGHRALVSGSQGRWATEQLLKAMESGLELDPSHLRTADLLRKEEWVELDDALITEASIRLRGIADLRRLGLTQKLKGGLGRTIFEYDNIGDMEDAQITMDGIVRTEDDRVEYGKGRLPLPIIHKDFNLNLRLLAASRLAGEGLDTTQTRICGRKIAEKLEYMLFNGGPTFAQLPIYGYLTHPHRNIVNFAGGGAWGAAGVTGEEMLADLNAMLAKMEVDQMPGPFILYISPSMKLALSGDYKAATTGTIRARMLELEGLSDIVVADQLPTNTAVLVQMTSDVVKLIEGVPLTNAQWDIEGGWRIAFKSFTLAVPLVRSMADPTEDEGAMGVCVLEAA